MERRGAQRGYTEGRRRANVIPEQPGIHRTILLPLPPEMVHRRVTRENFIVEAQGLADDLLKLYAFLRDQREYHDGAYDELARRLNEMPEEVSFAFSQENIAANQTDVQLIGFTARGYCARNAGSLIGVTGTINDALTGGTLTLEPTITDGTTGVLTATGLTVVIDSTNPRTNTSLQDAGIDLVNAGDIIGLRITTTGAFAPTTADLDAAIGVKYQGKFT